MTEIAGFKHTALVTTEWVASAFFYRNFAF